MVLPPILYVADLVNLTESSSVHSHLSQSQFLKTRFYLRLINPLQHYK